MATDRPLSNTSHFCSLQLDERNSTVALLSTPLQVLSTLLFVAGCILHIYTTICSSVVYGQFDSWASSPPITSHNTYRKINTHYRMNRLIHLAILSLSSNIDAFSSSSLTPTRTSFGPLIKYEPSHRIGTSSSLSSMISDSEADTLLDNFYDEQDFEDYGDELSSEAPTSVQNNQPIRRFKRPKKIPLIAVVGRPNVGKSALVNRLAGTQSGGAIVADEEGITRDRTYRNAEFLGEAFQLVDTGGLVFDDNDALFAKEIREQAMIAIEESAGVILVVDGQMGPTSMDEQLAIFLRKEVLKKMPVILAVNKCESDKNGAYLASQFWNLGLGEPHAVSALHGVGTAEVLESMFDGIVEKGSAIQGFGTKVKKLEEAQQALVAFDNDEPLEGEDETDVFLRKYGIGKGSEDVIKQYEEAICAFDDVPSMVSENLLHHILYSLLSSFDLTHLSSPFNRRKSM